MPSSVAAGSADDCPEVCVHRRVPPDTPPEVYVQLSFPEVYVYRCFLRSMSKRCFLRSVSSKHRFLMSMSKCLFHEVFVQISFPRGLCPNAFS